MSDKQINSITGQSQKWLIDVLGNVFLSGRLQVGGWIDPTFLQLLNQTGSAGVSSNSLFTLNNVLSVKDNSTVVKTITVDQMGPKCVASCVDLTTNLTSSLVIMTSATMALSSSSSKVIVVAGFQGTCTVAAIGVPRVILDRSGTIIAEYAQGTTPAGTSGRTWGGVIATVDTPATTSSRTYSLQLSTTLGGTWTVQGASIAVIEGTLI